MTKLVPVRLTIVADEDHQAKQRPTEWGSCERCPSAGTLVSSCREYELPVVNRGPATNSSASLSGLLSVGSAAEHPRGRRFSTRRPGFHIVGWVDTGYARAQRPLARRSGVSSVRQPPGSNEVSTG